VPTCWRRWASRSTCRKERVVAGIESVGLGFFFAPLYHPAFKAVAEARKMLAAEGQRSIFNVLGPLLNPGRPDYQLIGVFDPKLTRAFGEILVKLGRKGAWVVHGSAGADGQGMDELSTLGKNEVCQLVGRRVQKDMTLDPKTLGFADAKLERVSVVECGGRDARATLHRRHRCRAREERSEAGEPRPARDSGVAPSLATRTPRRWREGRLETVHTTCPKGGNCRPIRTSLTTDDA
jgi:hypothetical protein